MRSHLIPRGGTSLPIFFSVKFIFIIFWWLISILEFHAPAVVIDVLMSYHQLSANYFFPCHPLSAKPTHRLSADSVFTHLYSFVMGLAVVNTSPGGQYQLVCTIKYSTSNGSYLVGCHFKFIFN